MEKIVLFGKGGIGKSMVATNLTYAYADRGKKVLHIGCDPKSDSTWRLTHGEPVPTVIEQYVIHSDDLRKEHFIKRGVIGIDCVEAGGPDPGVGCGGRGISLMLQMFDDLNILEDSDYDTVVFDVLGDVVCGGFAAPLRFGFARKVFIVISEEVMSMYAANNIARAVCTYKTNGVILGGLIVNLRDNEESLEPMERFAETINTKILRVIHRDPLISESEREYQTLLEYAPDSENAGVFRDLADSIEKIDAERIDVPTPMETAEFHKFIRSVFGKKSR